MTSILVDDCCNTINATTVSIFEKSSTHALEDEMKNQKLAKISFGISVTAVSFIAALFSACENNNNGIPAATVPPPDTNRVAPTGGTKPANVLVRISAINDAYTPNHAEQVDVHPGDMIRLSADTFDFSQNFVAQGEPAEDFTWTSSESSDDKCDVALAPNCPVGSNFQATDYGVVYYVPVTMGGTISIGVIGRRGIPQGISDGVTLHNVDFGIGETPRQETITSASNYKYVQLNADFALIGQGSWVWIQGVRYFAPTTYVFSADRPWMPYRNGYWAWDTAKGWTWISYDPWGWFTDHYGVWRYHGSYGWVWLPFDDLHYEPSTATWFTDGAQHIGWFPYFDQWPAAYQHEPGDGTTDGFIDGFEQGVLAASHFGDDQFQSGFTIVHRADVTSANIYDVAIADRSIVASAVASALARSSFSHIPGETLAASRDFLESGASAKAPVATTIAVGASGRLFAPLGVRALPPAYSGVGGAGTAFKPLAVGTVRVFDLSRPTQTPTLLPPSTNGKAIVAAPQTHDGNGQSILMPVLSTQPAQPSMQNPIFRKRPAAAPHDLNPSPAKNSPAFQPLKPAPPPLTSKELPPATAAPPQSPTPSPGTAPTPGETPPPTPTPRETPHGNPWPNATPAAAPSGTPPVGVPTPRVTPDPDPSPHLTSPSPTPSPRPHAQSNPQD